MYKIIIELKLQSIETWGEQRTTQIKSHGNKENMN